jgi:hypothetical protein
MFATTTQTQEAPTIPSKEELLHIYLQEENAYLNNKDKASRTGPPPRYVAVFVNLDDWGPEEVIVYWLSACGSGGCNVEILTQEKDSFRHQSRMTIANPPIRVLDSKSYGGHDLGIWVRGGGIQPGREGRMQFNGNAYPLNPSAAPITPPNASGKTVITDEMLKTAIPLLDERP